MKKILFITLDDFSSINSSLAKQLHTHFPDYTFSTFEIKPILKKDYLALVRSVLAVFAEYYFDFITGNKKIKEWRKCLYHTTFIIKYFNRIIADHLKKNTYSFIFQTQSVFDSGNAHTPNFIYIDHTNLNNLNYPHINPKQYLTTKRYIKEESKIYEHATLLMVMSSNMKDSLVKQYGITPEKIKLVYAGSNTKISNPVDHGKYANKNILFVGKQWERKGGPVLIEAFKEVLKSVPEATLTILGCTPQVSIPNCTIEGDVSLDVVAEYYNKASVFCLPTVREPFGIVFVEAMLNKLAIVTNDMGATPELVINNKNGFRLNHDPKEYAKVLIALVQNPAMCEQFGNYSYELVKQNYTWNNVGDLIAGSIKENLPEKKAVV